MTNSNALIASVKNDPYNRGKVNIYKVFYDTPGNDIVVFTPPTGKSFYLKGIIGAEATIATELDLRFKERSAQLQGTVSVTNGSTIVTGTGTLFGVDFDTDIDPATEIIIDIAGTKTAATILYVNNDVQITLTAAYSGNTGSGFAYARQDTFIQPELNPSLGLLAPVVKDGWILSGRPGWSLAINSSVAFSQLLLMIQAGTSEIFPELTNTPDISQMKLTFEDNFDGPTLDTTKWNTTYWWGGRSNDNNFEQQWYVDNAFSFSNSILTITCTNVSVQPGYPYTSGILSAHNKFSQKYGYFTARIQVPSGRGFWPAWWFGSADFSWPPELDVMEMRGDDIHTTHSNTHYDVGAGPAGEGYAKNVSIDLSADFHEYSMYWTPDFVAFYLDGVEYFRSIGNNVPTKAMYPILDFAVGGNFPGSPDGTTVFPNYMKVDYVRIYSLPIEA